MNFNELGIIAPILKAVADEGYETPSPIQTESIPILLAGKDLLGCAQTGTGKTAAFAIPILQKLYEERAANGKARKLQALVLTPTRELAMQVYESFNTYGRFTGLKSAAIFGGVAQNPQTIQLKAGIDILVATPGRLNDLINQKLCNLNDISMFVLDEADRMLDMGFIHDVKKIIAKIPKNRQTLLFSATMPTEIEKLANSILNKPETVMVTPVSSTVETIEQSVYFVDKINKGMLLGEILKDDTITSALIFSRTKHGADRITRLLNTAGVAAAAIHSNKSQTARQAALSGLKAGKIRVLVATDIAARGIDIDELSHVINYDLPNIPESYVHRIGRTGRAGQSGIAISFCDFDEKAYLKDIQKLIGFEIKVVKNVVCPMRIFEHVEPQTRPRRERSENTPKTAKENSAKPTKSDNTNRYQKKKAYSNNANKKRRDNSN